MSLATAPTSPLPHRVTVVGGGFAGLYAARNLGIDPEPRLAQIDQIYCGGDPALAARLADGMGADYLLEGTPRACEPTVFDGSPYWALAYEDGRLRIWRLVGAPPVGARGP